MSSFVTALANMLHIFNPNVQCSKEEKQTKLGTKRISTKYVVEFKKQF